MASRSKLIVMNRRNALRAGATLFGVPWQKVMASPATPLPDDALFSRDPEAYWTRMRDEQFLLPQWRSFLNNGSLGRDAPPGSSARREVYGGVRGARNAVPVSALGLRDAGRGARGVVEISRLQERRARHHAQRHGGVDHRRLRARPEVRRRSAHDQSGACVGQSRLGGEAGALRHHHSGSGDSTAAQRSRAIGRADDFRHRPQNAHCEFQRNPQRSGHDPADPRNLRRRASQRRTDAGRRRAHARPDAGEALRSELRFLRRQSAQVDVRAGRLRVSCIFAKKTSTGCGR